MESITKLKRRTTDLLQSLPSSLPTMPDMPSMPSMPAMPAMPTMPSVGSLGSLRRAPAGNTMKGTWEHIDNLPPLPRSSHSIDIVDGKAYLFGGEVDPRKPVDNKMHVIVLPFSGAPADYYTIRPAPAKPSVPIAEEDDGTTTTGKDPAAAGLDDVPLGSPTTTTTTVPTPATEPTVPDSQPPEGDLAAQQQQGGKGKEPALPEQPPLPPPRVGHATAVIGSRIFLFGGRGGPDMKPLDERGRVWIFDTKTATWSFLDPAPPARPPPLAAGPPPAATLLRPTYPPPRSYHAAVAVEKPSLPPSGAGGARPRRAESWREWLEGDSARVGTPQAPIVGNVAERARDADEDGYGTLIVHAGCLADGTRAADVWAFDVRSRVWKELPAAPAPGRGGTALAVGRGRLYRFGGFNGETEEGGRLDYLDLGVDSFDDVSSFGEVSVVARGDWQSFSAYPADGMGYRRQVAATLSPSAADDDDGGEDNGMATVPLRENSGPTPPDWPGPRSVASLQAVTTGGGRDYLVLMLGERHPSGAGHEAAGQFYDDVWAFQVPSETLSTASMTDTVFGVLGRKTGEGTWTRVVLEPYDDDDGASAAAGPGPRGWVASAPMGGLEENGIVIWGGLDAENKRLGDGWIMRLGPEKKE